MGSLVLAGARLDYGLGERHHATALGPGRDLVLSRASGGCDLVEKAVISAQAQTRQAQPPGRVVFCAGNLRLSNSIPSNEDLELSAY